MLELLQMKFVKFEPFNVFFEMVDAMYTICTV